MVRWLFRHAVEALAYTIAAEVAIAAVVLMFGWQLPTTAYVAMLCVLLFAAVCGAMDYYLYEQERLLRYLDDRQSKRAEALIARALGLLDTRALPAVQPPQGHPYPPSLPAQANRDRMARPDPIGPLTPGEADAELRGYMRGLFDRSDAGDAT